MRFYLYAGLSPLLTRLLSLDYTSGCYQLVCQLIAIGWTLCLFYHLSNGIRHLFWDAGVGLEITQARISGWVVVFAAIFLTALSWAGALIN